MSGVVSRRLSGFPDECCWFQVALMGPWMCVVVPDILLEDKVIWKGVACVSCVLVLRGFVVHSVCSLAMV